VRRLHGCVKFVAVPGDTSNAEQGISVENDYHKGLIRDALPLADGIRMGYSANQKPENAQVNIRMIYSTPSAPSTVITMPST